MKTLLIAIIIMMPVIGSAQNQTAMRIASDVAEMTQGYIGETKSFDGVVGIHVVPNEYMDFTMMRTMIGMIHHSHHDLSVAQSWKKEDDGYIYVLARNRTEFYAIYYTDGNLIVYYQN